MRNGLKGSLFAFWVAARKRYSFVEVFSPKLDNAFFRLVHRRWPAPGRTPAPPLPSE